jgi:hypothetical protein
MNVSLAIAINLFAMSTLIGLLAYVMTRPTRLRRHLGATDVPVAVEMQLSRGVPMRRRRRAEAAVAAVGS